ncbi:MAG: hypothetical protein CVV64_03595 [Candidatus Wallbacteria bacterium HGW-Wallbacteria-1]|jgi:prepilin-type N-terminal cleavage/methylation domain-containing protein|uniref:Prepilin-type N-terminal cleavage/methylation domain-containing protein n=1 Tax=Candidatus Wallbacteria bacterium HGW-Wallbacteria-1 TaxID=2013854 RepID=A0A2N1PTT7_9BACT|nr:MAG: hypothetical protein CVV64_03595 [Candidatus Wallbacteria bacterium HGW-Wallbacteria-1]
MRLFEKRGFSLVELLISLVITGIVIVPILSIFRAGKKGSIQNTDFFLANNLARERIEELRLLPFDRIKGDFDVFASIFGDSREDKIASLATNRTEFNKNFNDIYAQKGRGAHEGPLKEFYEAFRGRYRYYYGRDYEDYPSGYGIYRRVTKVEDYPVADGAQIMKKISVTVSHRDGRVLAQIVTLMEAR